jgi:hypothetical protein
VLRGLRVGVVMLALGVGLGGGAGVAQGKPKAKLKVLATDQSSILDEKAIEVRATRLKGRELRLRAASRTFDRPEYRKLSKKGTARKGARVARLRLKPNGLDAVRSCEARTVKVKGKGAKAVRFDLRRTTNRCRPRPIDLTRADECDPITLATGATAGEPLCMLPFPDDFHTTEDYTSATGRRVAFQDSAMPKNSGDVPIAAEPYNLNDGFSPGQSIVVKVPGIDTPDALEATDPIRLSGLSRNDDERAGEPVVVIDAKTGERWPIWVEIDSTANTPEETALLIHPARNFDSGRRYIVALRHLLPDAYYHEEGLEAPDGFRYYRDDLPSKDAAINAQRERFDRVFRNLRKAGVKRSNLYLAWDFTVASDENIAERMLAIRNDAFAELGDDDLGDRAVAGAAPEFAVTSVETFTMAQDPELARRVLGTFEVPCYLAPNCNPGGTFDLGPDGLPQRNGSYTADFHCGIPRKAVDAPAIPGRPQVYGHGLLGTASQATSDDQKILGQTHNFVICATDTIGFSEADVPNIAANVLRQLGNFPQLTDRVQQGLLNTLFLGRLMIHADGFTSDAAFHADGSDVSSPPVIDTSRLYYNGNSQGGILGGAANAVAPDWTRATLGVPAMNYSVLLNRSVDFDLYKTILDRAYPSPLTQQLALSMIQMLWDRSEPNGYAHRMTDNPLPGTPAHEVLLNVAFGDHQVTTWQADVEARTIGAAAHVPVVYDGRWPDIDVLWGVPEIPSYPYTGSAIVYWDSGPTRPDPGNPGEFIGTDPPPVENQPNRSGEDPHGDPRVAPEEMQMVSDFLRPDAQSQITDTCLGLACFAGGFTGPP